MILQHTYYKIADTNDYPGQSASVVIRTRDGSPIAAVPQGFSNDLSLEGSGVLADGRIVNYAGTGGACRNGTPGYGGHLYCYRVLDGAQYPWGAGHGVPVEPLRSIAVDPRYIPFGSVVYIREFDGLRIPAIADSRGRIVGGFVHDGKFRAEDSGGAIGANHIDIYAGPNAMYRWLESHLPSSYPNGSGLTASLLPASAAPPRGALATAGVGPVGKLALLGLAGYGAWYLWKVLR